ncbi:MAG: NAD(P)H-dependent oxidoreductase [Clostridiales bacterium]|nr:NAD(P)H-dependent oxidoreductase [Clostridiales bacterium]
MKITAVNGSPDKNGNTAFLLREILSCCTGAETEIINVGEVLSDAKTPFCVNCSSPCSKVCYKGTKLDDAFKKITCSDFVIFGSPVYFGSMSAQLKAFFDKTRAVRGEKAWLGKPMAAVSVGASKFGGEERTIEHIQSCALVLGMTVVGNGSELGMGHFGVSAQRPAKDDQNALIQCKSLANTILNC